MRKARRRKLQPEQFKVSPDLSSRTSDRHTCAQPVELRHSFMSSIAIDAAIKEARPVRNDLGEVARKIYSAGGDQPRLMAVFARRDSVAVVLRPEDPARLGERFAG